MLPLVRDDDARVAALRDLKLLDLPPQKNFDYISRLCAAMLGCRLSLISLVDQDRQWFLSSEGLDAKETPRDISFCHHTIAEGDTFAVADASIDERFATNPLVQGDPHIRSYLGHPIRGPEGHLLGALCVADDKPRIFSQQDRDRLIAFTAVVEELIAAHSESLAKGELNELLWNEARALRKSNRLLKQAEKIGGIGAWELNLETRTLQFSDQMYLLCGLLPGTAVDTIRALNFYHKDDRSRVDQAIRRAAMTGCSIDYEADLIGADGVLRRIRCVGERFEGVDNRFAKIVGVIQDITSAHHAHLALKRAADYDSLTGLYNRYAFDRCLKDKIKTYKSANQSLAMIMIDLDGFKDINDTFGHITGDVVLEEISARVRKVTDCDTVLARWGGDEFAVLPPLGSSEAEVCAIAERLLSAIGTHVDVGVHKLQLSGTCGVAWYDEGMQTRELLRRADLALYEGKKRERRAVHLYHPRLEAANHARQIAMAEVRKALDEDRVYAAYQPIVKLEDGSLVGFEALMRLNTARGGKITAGAVLPALLDPILSREITTRMLTSVCEDIAMLRAAHPDLQFVSINVAESDLLSRGFASKMIGALKQAGVPERMVTLEITETMLLVNDNATVRNVLEDLHSAGMSIALDDFGTGYSSLSHLRDFPIDKVKIDSSCGIL